MDLKRLFLGDSMIDEISKILKFQESTNIRCLHNEIRIINIFKYEIHPYFKLICTIEYNFEVKQNLGMPLAALSFLLNSC